MANGFLTGRYDADTKFEAGAVCRSFMPQYTGGDARGRKLLELLTTLAAEKNTTPAQISLAWLLCKRDCIIPIPGSRNPERLRENLGAAEVMLSAEDISKIDGKLASMDLIVFVFGGHSTK